MRALVVYESMYGNTHVVAASIADSLRATHDVTLVPVAEATRELAGGADLLGHRGEPGPRRRGRLRAGSGEPGG